MLLLFPAPTPVCSDPSLFCVRVCLCHKVYCFRDRIRFLRIPSLTVYSVRQKSASSESSVGNEVGIAPVLRTAAFVASVEDVLGGEGMSMWSGSVTVCPRVTHVFLGPVCFT